MMNHRYFKGMTHSVKEGETLFQISRFYRVPLALILRANPYVDVYNLQPNQKIYIPVSKQAQKPFAGNRKRRNYGGQSSGGYRTHQREVIEPAEPAEQMYSMEKMERMQSEEPIEWTQLTESTERMPPTEAVRMKENLGPDDRMEAADANRRTELPEYETIPMQEAVLLEHVVEMD